VGLVEESRAIRCSVILLDFITICEALLQLFYIDLLVINVCVSLNFYQKHRDKNTNVVSLPRPKPLFS